MELKIACVTHVAKANTRKRAISEDVLDGQYVRLVLGLLNHLLVGIETAKSGPHAPTARLRWWQPLHRRITNAQPRQMLSVPRISSRLEQQGKTALRWFAAP